MHTISEKILHKIWYQNSLGRHRWFTESGQSLVIIYPGRPNEGRGGDFCDAVISIDGIRLSGQIELHIEPSGWQAHGHHQDHNYNAVILHIVLRGNGSYFTTLSSGCHIPIVSLEKNLLVPYLAEPRLDTMPHHHCHTYAGRQHVKENLKVLEQAGESRFFDKAAAIQGELAVISPAQLLYQGIMEALGYSKAQKTFRQLSHEVNLSVLESLNSTGITNKEYLSLIFSRLSSRLDNSKSVYETYRNRPNNSPRLRLLALAALLVRYRDQGILNGLLEAVTQAYGKESGSSLENALIVRPYHVSSLEKSEALSGLTPLGQDRARLIIINILLPFAYAIGLNQNNHRLSQHTLELYRLHRSSALNCIEKHMLAQLGLTTKLIRLSCHQQGLLYLYKSYCIRGNCSLCPLGQHQIRDDIQVEVIGTGKR